MIETRPQKSRERALLIGLKRKASPSGTCTIPSMSCASWRTPPEPKLSIR